MMTDPTEDAQEYVPTSWYPPPLSETFSLKDKEVHVWRAVLDVEASRIQSLQQSLSTDEWERARRFHFQKDRDHFIAARGLLRVILGLYLSKEPDQLQFCYGPYGKPSLTQEFGGDTLRFNLSHSYGLALFAITRGRELGVDLEQLRSQVTNIQIAERFFSPREVAALRALPINLQQEAFFTCWTCKEAYLKARGEGLTHPLDQFDVSFTPGEPARLLNTYKDPQEASRWSLYKLNPGPGYAAALAVEGHNWKLKCWQWQEPF